MLLHPPTPTEPAAPLGMIYTEGRVGLSIDRRKAETNMNTLRTFAFASPSLAFVSTLFAQTPKPVRTQAGLVQGTTEDGITVYKGIPFVAPPVGDLRWRAAATWPGPACETPTNLRPRACRFPS